MSLEHACVGVLGGVGSRTVTAPIERIRVFQQAQTSSVSSLTAFRQMLSQDGVRGLWRGNGVNCFRIAPNQFLRHGSNHWIQSQLSQVTQNKYQIWMGAGALAGIVATLGTYPFDLVRSLLSIKHGQEAPSIRSVTRQIYSQGGLLGFYRGCLMSCIGVAPYFSLNVTFSSALKDYQLISNRTLNNLVAGGLAGMGAVILTYPTDLVKRRLMLKGGRILPTIKSIFVQEGHRGFYRGMGLAVVRIIPGNALQWMIIHELSHG